MANDVPPYKIACLHFGEGRQSLHFHPLSEVIYGHDHVHSLYTG